MGRQLSPYFCADLQRKEILPLMNILDLWYSNVVGKIISIDETMR